MRYQVTQQFIGRPESELRLFKDYKDAKQFMEEKLTSDALYKLKSIYRIYEDEVLKEQWDQEKWQQHQQDSTSTDSGSEGSGAAGIKGQSAFRPTPLSASPHPRGTPSKWLTDDQDKDKNE